MSGATLLGNAALNVVQLHMEQLLVRPPTPRRRSRNGLLDLYRASVRGLRNMVAPVVVVGTTCMGMWNRLVAMLERLSELSALEFPLDTLTRVPLEWASPVTVANMLPLIIRELRDVL